MNQRSTGHPRSFGNVMDHLPPDPPIEDEDPDDGDHEDGEYRPYEIVQIIPADGWTANYEHGSAPVICWALVKEFCEHGVQEGERVWGMVSPPGWDGGPSPHWVFAGEAESPEDHFPALGDFLGFELG